MSSMRRGLGFKPDGSWRVILVGRTGLDQALRRDAGIELIRARDAIDAIGELSDPIDARSPSEAVVVVAPDAEPGGSGTLGFLDALRRVDRGVRLIRVGGQAPGYDASVAAGADAASFRSCWRGLRPLAPSHPTKAEHPKPPPMAFLPSGLSSPKRIPSPRGTSRRRRRARRTKRRCPLFRRPRPDATCRVMTGRWPARCSLGIPCSSQRWRSRVSGPGVTI